MKSHDRQGVHCKSRLRCFWLYCVWGNSIFILHFMKLWLHENQHTSLLIVVNSLGFQLMGLNPFQVLSDFAHSRDAIS